MPRNDEEMLKILASAYCVKAAPQAKPSLAATKLKLKPWGSALNAMGESSKSLLSST